jgi:hypothetical protein
MKTRLLPDPERAPVAHQIFAWRVTGRLGYRENGKANQPNEWVWSPQPTHEPVVTREMFEAAGEVAIQR